MYSVLFVCAANICRSPLAMGLLRSLTAGEPGWRIESAGVWASAGHPAASYSRQVLVDFQVNLDQHESRPVTPDLLASTQLILTMEKNQKEALQIAFPQFAERIYLVSELIGRSEDIPDPIGGSLADFQQTRQELYEILSQGMRRLRELAQEAGQPVEGEAPPPVSSYPGADQRPAVGRAE